MAKKNKKEDELMKKAKNKEAPIQRDPSRRRVNAMAEHSPSTITPAEMTEEDMKEKQIAELKDALARCMADMQNFKRRSDEDRISFVKFANAELLKELLPIIDNFNRSCEHLPDTLKDDAWAKGVVHTHDDLMKALNKIGVKRIETVGQKMDPTKHEALIQGEGEKDIILEELEPGYVYNEKVLKAAKVKVGSG